MSKRSSKRAVHAVPGSAPPPAVTDSDWRSRPLFVTAVTIGFALLLGLYAWWFYRVPFQPDLPRYQFLAYLLVPDQLLLEWRGVPDGEVAIGDRLPLVLLAGVIVLIAFLLGRLMLSLLSVTRRLHRLEYIALTMGTGLSAVSLLTLAAGLSGMLDQPLVFIAAGMVIVVVSAWQEWRRVGRRPADGSAARAEDRDASPPWWRPRVAWLAIPFVVVICAGALLPSIDFDVLEYHLQVPREWVEAGRITFLPHNVYGNMPLGAEALVVLAMALSPGELGWWWGALTGKLLMAVFAPLTAVLLVAAGRRFATVTAGVLAALLYLSTPWIGLVSMSGLNDGVVAFYVLAAAYCAKAWLDERHADPRTARDYLWLAGWMAGSAAACKYTAVVFVVVPLVILVVLMSRRETVRGIAALLLAVALASGLWYAKSWVQTGNPVYPLMASVFEGRSRTPEKDEQFRRAHRVPVDAAGRRYSPQQAWNSLRLVLGQSLWHSPLLIPAAALILLRRRTLRQAGYWVSAFLLLVALWWLFTHRIDRFLVPAWPLLALAAGIGLTWSDERVWRVTMWSVLGLGLAANWVLIASPVLADNRYLVRLDQLRDDPQFSTLTVAHRYLNEHVPAGGRVLLVGDAAVFPLRVPFLYSTCFDDCLLDDILRERDPESRRARFAELGITHLYVNWSEIRRYRQPGNYGFPPSITSDLIDGQLESRQRLIRRVPIPELDPEQGEVFEVLTAPD